ncbi:MAG: metallophosphoesterase [Candidatus Gastranaerophilales bacterium]|nr:metallophosphoesterase [Candidatus Gastranaerophilales bacterium]
MTKEMLVLIAFFVFVLIRSVFIEPNSLEIKRYAIEDKQLQGIRVAFLSDFHLKRRDYKRLDKIVKLTNQEKPNIVFLGGDYVAGHNIKKTMSPDIMASKLSLLNTQTYAVLGEHDWWVDGKLITSALRSNGIRVLENTNMRIISKNRYIDIIGLSDATTKQVNISQAFRRTGTPRIVLTHNPDVYYDIIENTNLVLAGHTHGGQFVIPFTKPVFVSSRYGSKLASGLIKETRNRMIVSKGLGMTGFPLRLNCKPEITIIDFVGTYTPAKKKKFYFH